MMMILRDLYGGVDGRWGRAGKGSEDGNGSFVVVGRGDDDVAFLLTRVLMIIMKKRKKRFQSNLARLDLIFDVLYALRASVLLARAATPKLQRLRRSTFLSTPHGVKRTLR
jgi:hypothetical protein